MEPNPTAPALFRPEIIISDPQTQQKSRLRLSELSLEIKVRGSLAATTMECTFYNDHEVELEGELILPLQEGMTVTRYALDIKGKMREGVVVEKEKARKVFEEIVRRNVDPGLVEKVQGNQFKTRVYPLPAKGYRKIRLGFEQTLTYTPRGLNYRMPLDFPEALDRFYFRIDVFQPEQAPQMEGENWAEIDFNGGADGFFAEREFTDYTAKKTLSIILPKDPTTPEVFVEQGRDGQFYFHVHCLPERQSIPRPTPTHIGLYWDVSGSAKQRDWEKEYAVLDAWFQEIENFYIEVFPFSHQVHSGQSFHIHGGNWEELRNYLEGLVIDGGTMLGALDFRQFTGQEIMVFTDGLQSYGANEMQLGEVPVMVINSAVTAQHAYLKRTAEAGGGQYLNLSRLTVDQAVDRLKQLPYLFLGAEFANGAPEEVVPSRPVAIDKEFTLSGRIRENHTQVTLHFGRVGERLWSTTYRLRFPENLNHTSGLVERLWASQRLAELESAPEPDRETIVAHAKAHHLVTDYTSLLVLEEVEDYVKHNIQPPSELRAQFDQIRKNAREEKQDKKAEVQKNLETWFKELVTWWNTDYPVKPAPEERKKKGGLFGGRLRSESTGAEPEMDFMMAADQEAPMMPMSEMNAGAPPPRSMEMEEERERGVMFSRAAPAGSPMVEAKKEDAAGSRGQSATINIKNWDPDEPYLKVLENANDPYVAYLEQREAYAQSPAFFLDVADFFLRQGDSRGIRILSNISELKLGSERLLRLLAYKLLEMGHSEPAIKALEAVTKLKPEEPQSWRDLADALARNGQYQEAANHYLKVVTEPWEDRFPRIQLIALEELNALIATCGQPIDTGELKSGFLKNLPVDLRVELSWDADATDLDLWVTDPEGEKCFYSNKLTRLGGRMSNDFTQGYGPEVFMLKKGPAGKYKVAVNYFSDSQQNLAGPPSLIVRFYTRYGTPKQELQEVVLRVKTVKQEIHVGEFELK